MAAALMQQGSKGAMRDLDYINPRQPKASSALPPDVRRKLGLDRARASSASPAEAAPLEFYQGARNAEPKKGKSGAGTDWANPNGHAFIRRGSGIAMSQRASRAAQLAGAGAALIANQSKAPRAPSRDRAGLPPRSRVPSSEMTAMARDCGSPEEFVSRAPSRELQNQDGNSNRPPQARSNSVPPMAPQSTDGY